MPTSLEDQVRLIAKDLGFEDCRFARAKRASHAEEFQEWFRSFMLKNSVYLVTGSDYSKTIQQK